jgi:hypothetical protein
VNLRVLLCALLRPCLCSRLLHLSLGFADLLARLVELPARLLGLLTVLAVLPGLRVEVLLVPDPLLLEVSDALAELILS